MKYDNNTEDTGKAGSSRLVDAKGLLEALFAPTCRPSIRWVRQMQAQRTIPYIKIGHLVRFDVEQVRQALHERCRVSRRPD